MNFVVRTLLGLAVLLSGAAVLEMLVAYRSIRSRMQWNAVFFPAGAFLVMSVTILADLGWKAFNTPREYLLAAVTVALALGSVTGATSLLRIMRDQQEREEEMDFLRLRYERLFKGNDMPIVVFDNATLAIVDVNGAGEALFGRTRDELRTMRIDAVGFEEDFATAMAEAERDGTGALELGYRTLTGDRCDLLIHLSVVEVAEADLAYGIIEDVTERNAARAELLRQKELLEHLADHDALTGLPNRRVLDVVLEHAFARSRRDVPSTMLFIDVDDFKEVNDQQGHQAGDAALTAIARLLDSGVRDGDVVVRLGGDEFAILLEGMELAGGTAIAERLVRSVRERYADLGLSIGVAPMVGAADVVEVIRTADERMYAAKKAGGNRVVVGDA